MTTTHTAAGSVALSARLVAGVAGGLVGGVAFGVMMQAFGMLPMVAMLVGSESVAVGWLVHLANSALFGALFAVLIGRWAANLPAALGAGLAYGLAWWVLGALLIMPAWLGMNAMIFQLDTGAWRSLAGHLVFGLLLGLVYAVTGARAGRVRDRS
ncbi:MULTISPECIES: hypothetical protein [unclassified Micromonospora]|uniref:hypothetical protein n=1 Tax=unclassified Micromonospora TaxID=2617518 RepID=UPI003632B7A9